MSRIVELLIALNALGGIATYLGFRFAGRKARDQARRLRGDRASEDDDVPPPALEDKDKS